MPALKRRRSAGTPQAAEKLAEAIARRMPERSLLSIVARTAYWLGWHQHGERDKVGEATRRAVWGPVSG
jgi:predicted secreted Zn-dependent protease